MLVQVGADLGGRLGAEPRLHGSVDRPGSVDVDRNAAAGHLGSQVERVGFERSLGGGVGVQSYHGPGMVDDPARDVHDPAPTPILMRVGAPR